MHTWAPLTHFLRHAHLHVLFLEVLHGLQGLLGVHLLIDGLHSLQHHRTHRGSYTTAQPLSAQLLPVSAFMQPSFPLQVFNVNLVFVTLNKMPTNETFLSAQRAFYQEFWSIKLTPSEIPMSNIFIIIYSGSYGLISLL